MMGEQYGDVAGQRKNSRSAYLSDCLFSKLQGCRRGTAVLRKLSQLENLANVSFLQTSHQKECGSKPSN